MKWTSSFTNFYQKESKAPNPVSKQWGACELHVSVLHNIRSWKVWWIKWSKNVKTYKTLLLLTKLKKVRNNSLSWDQTVLLISEPMLIAIYHDLSIELVSMKEKASFSAAGTKSKSIKIAAMQLS